MSMVFKGVLNMTHVVTYYTTYVWETSSEVQEEVLVFRPPQELLTLKTHHFFVVVVVIVICSEVTIDLVTCGSTYSKFF